MTNLPPPPPPPPPGSVPPPPPPSGGAWASSGEPVQFSFEGPLEIARWRPIANVFIAIPHLVIAYLLNIVGQVCAFISFFTILFKRQVPETVHNARVLATRYQLRAMSYALFLRETYPPFEFDLVEADPGTDQVRLTILRQQQYNRWAPLYKWFLAIPHYIVLLIFFIGAYFAIIGAFFAVIFTGKYPAGIREYVIKVTRYGLKVTAYATLFRDEYPEFGLK